VLLVVDDEAQIRRAVRNALAPLAEQVVEAASGGGAIDLAASASPDLIVLDLGLPDMPGLEVCRAVRGWARTPILVLTARHAEADKLALFDAGADDYVTKPFSLAELEARARALLRRAGAAAAAGGDAVVRTADGLVVDLARRQVLRDGQALRLTPTEWELLRALVAAGGRVLTHQQLYDAVWGRAYGDAPHLVRVHVANLRRKVEPDPAAPRVVVTEPGVGYRFEG
jgi:two-component system KDP operon response regulator KdpE